LGLGNIQWIPSLSTGFTDSRFTRLLGTETYGLIGSHPDDDPLDTKIHGVDESESVRSLVTGTKVMLALAYQVLVK
jgi:acetylornithine deacetylase/succinyl-diaminopimelate desuccinylase-like protein